MAVVEVYYTMKMLPVVLDIDKSLDMYIVGDTKVLCTAN